MDDHDDVSIKNSKGEDVDEIIIKINCVLNCSMYCLFSVMEI